MPFSLNDAGFRPSLVAARRRVLRTRATLVRPWFKVVWGAGVPPKPPEMAGLDHFTLRFDSPERLQEVLSRHDDAERQEQSFLVHDPDDNAIRLEAR